MVEGGLAEREGTINAAETLVRRVLARIGGPGTTPSDRSVGTVDRAASRCRNTAVPDRRNFCEVFDRKCDGTAK